MPSPATSRTRRTASTSPGSSRGPGRSRTTRRRRCRSLGCGPDRLGSGRTSHPEKMVRVMGIDTLTEYIVVGVGLLILLGGLVLGLLRTGGGSTKELQPEHRPPERPKGSTDHRNGTIVLDRPCERARPQVTMEVT